MIKFLALILLGFTPRVWAGPSSVKTHPVILAMASELQQAKTVGDWINRSSPKTKAFRRKYFSHYMNEKIPQVIIWDSSLLLFDNKRKKSPSVLRVEGSEKNLRVTWNGYDLTKPKKMNFEKWFKKTFPAYSRTAQFKPLDFLIPQADAQQDTTVAQMQNSVVIDPMALSYWTAMMASTANQDWENKDLVATMMEDGRALIAAGLYMRDNYKLSCSADGKAHFDFPYSDFAEHPLKITASYDSEKKLARIALSRTQPDSLLKMKMGELARVAYPVMGLSEALPGATAGQVYLFNSHTNKNSIHDSLREGNLLESLYMAANKVDDMTMAPPSGAAMNDIYDRTQGVVALADFARACCSNSQCRGQAQLPSSETKTSQ